MKNELLNTLLEDVQFVDIMNNDILNEGSYTESQKFGLTNPVSKKYDEHLTKAKTAKRDKDYKLALHEFKTCKSLIPKLQSEADKISDDKGWSKFIAALSTTGISLTKRYRDEKTGTQAYYRIWMKEYIASSEKYLDEQIAEMKSKL